MDEAKDTDVPPIATEGDPRRLVFLDDSPAPPPELVARQSAVLQRLWDENPAHAEAVAVIMRASDAIRRASQDLAGLGQLTASVEIREMRQVIEALWLVTLQEAETPGAGKLRSLARAATEIVGYREAEGLPLAPAKVEDVVRHLDTRLRTLTDEVGAVDAATGKSLRLTRWQVARYVLAPALLPFVQLGEPVTARDGSKRWGQPSLDVVGGFIYQRMPLALGGRADLRATDRKGAFRDKPFEEDVVATLRGALRGIGLPAVKAKNAANAGPSGKG